MDCRVGVAFSITLDATNGTVTQDIFEHQGMKYTLECFRDAAANPDEYELRLFASEVSGTVYYGDGSGASSLDTVWVFNDGRTVLVRAARFNTNGFTNFIDEYGIMMNSTGDFLALGQDTLIGGQNIPAIGQCTLSGIISYNP